MHTFKPTHTLTNYKEKILIMEINYNQYSDEKTFNLFKPNLPIIGNYTIHVDKKTVLEAIEIKDPQIGVVRIWQEKKDFILKPLSK